MPYFVMKMIFDIIPQRAPWFLRWFLSIMFKQISAQVVDKEIKANVNMVSSLTIVLDFY